MCGICGFYGLEDKPLIKKMTNILSHRGPDDSGYFIDKNITLAHRRLSIIDIKGGHQPIHNEDETVWVVFNGEIYNYKELRERLENKNHKFYTNTDTETIIHAYEEFGLGFVKHLDGDFAFALYDKNKKRLILARDKLGVKPIYYSNIDDKLLFASEIKSILQYPGFKRTLNMDAVNEFFTFTYPIAPNTMFQNIQMLPPATILIYENNKILTKKYWTFSMKDEILTENEIIKKIKRYLNDAVEKRMFSDVPIGAFLSGGLDSSYVVALMSKFSDNPVNTFSVSFGESSDETKFAKIIADKFDTNHRELKVDSSKPKLLPEVTWHLDTPAADVAAIPTYLMSEVTSKYVKVVLTGDGGDEVFGGYKKYAILSNLNTLKNKIPTNLKSKIISLGAMSGKTTVLRRLFDNISSLSTEDEYLSYISAFTNDEKLQALQPSITDQFNLDSAKKVIQKHFNENISFTNNMMFFDLKTLLPDDYLMKVDKMTMANSLEARVPFLDSKLVEFMASLNPKYKVNNFSTKYIFKKVLKEEGIPRTILNRKKHGFNVPTSSWLDGELGEIVSQLFSSRHRNPYINSRYARKVIQDFNKSKRYYSKKFWTLFTFEIWRRMYFEQEDIKKPLSFDKLLSL
ncbi:MAG: asparagine synthase (glutamine-hydrolyzing) [DPANN group archaeon]|nr:asparagine synthase (glutamine-hydrolyzing) [DPANN group archaeon]